MCKNILLHIKHFYGEIFNKKFINLYNFIREKEQELKQYELVLNPKKFNIKNYLTFGEISEKMINEIKESLSLETLSLLVDDYELIYSERGQKGISMYFDFFDKVVLASNENSLTETSIEDLKNKGYSFLKVNYGTNLKYLKEILREKLIAYNGTLRKDEKSFPFEELTDDLLTDAIKLSGGNIGCIFESLNKTNYQFQYFDNIDIQKLFIEEVKKEMYYKVTIPNRRNTKKLHL